MDRLIDKKGRSSGAEAALVELIAACEPVTTSADDKERALGAIYTRHHERRRSLRFASHLAIAAVLTLVASAAAAAVFVGHLRARPAPETPVAVAPAPVHHRARSVAAPLVAPPPALEPSPERDSSPAPVRHARFVRSEDPTLVVTAIQALRQDHDPQRAAHLLATYLRTYPHGALTEEAIALSIEAADARHSPAAEVFAARYLRDYPQGRFHAVAQRRLARP